MSGILLIAELSMNHMGDMSLAKEMIDAAAQSGADYAKFQTWKVDRLRPGAWDDDGRRGIYQQAELTAERHIELRDYCNKVGIKFLTSVFNAADLDMVRGLTPDVKIPGPECKNDVLVNAAIRKFDNVFVSTGSSDPSEYLPYAPYSNVWLMHCVSIYPCPAEQVNLPRLGFLAQVTPRVGYSGHYFGIWDAIAAISLGAKVVEKHFTTNRKLPFRDNQFAILPGQMSMIRQFANECPKMKLPQGLGFQAGEQIIRSDYAGRWNG